jgi:hypothetical protein
MGVLIGYYDWSQRISPVSPMPSLDFNVLSAVQQIKTGWIFSKSTDKKYLDRIVTRVNIFETKIVHCTSEEVLSRLVLCCFIIFLSEGF